MSITNVLNTLGNFKQFAKDEAYIGYDVTWYAYYGACFMILIKLKYNYENLPDKGSLDGILPDNENIAPYCVDKNVSNNLSILQYLFSNKSDFPYAVRSGKNELDVHLSFFGGMISYLFLVNRYAIKQIIYLLDVKNPYVNVFSFYILPLLHYLIWIPIIPFISFFVINVISSITQKRAQYAYLIAYAGFINWFVFNNLGGFPPFTYLYNGFFGLLTTFFFTPLVSILSSFAVWGYVIALLNFTPIFLIAYAGMSFGELFKQLRYEIGDHYKGLSLIFLYLSIASAYKNLEQNVAYGVTIGILIIGFFILDIWGIIVGIYNYLFGTD